METIMYEHLKCKTDKKKTREIYCDWGRNYLPELGDKVVQED
jgi:hypothetical protein